MNLCTPGTNVVMNGQLFLPHCVSSTSKTYHGEQWVMTETEVRGNTVMRHKIDGIVVLEYTQPQLDNQDPRPRTGQTKRRSDARPRDDLLQSKAIPLDFRKVELLVLDPK